MNIQQRIRKVSLSGWIKAACWSAIYIVFVVWVAWGDWASLGWLAVLPLIIDMFTTKLIPYSWWKRYKPGKGQWIDGEWHDDAVNGTDNPHANNTLYTIFSWIDAIAFALIAVYFINLYLFQNYQIPSSSLEKSLRVGDFLFVSKMSYGARVPNTPLSMPLVQHTFPEWLGGGKSYIDHPQWEYKRLKGWDKPERGDIVVFNFPTGDTVCTKMQNPDYYTLCYYYGKHIVENRKDVFGDIVVRPVDRRENYVKRCVGEPGDSLMIVDNIVYTKDADPTDSWEMEPTRDGVQLNYLINTGGHILSASYLDKLGVSKDDRHRTDMGLYHMPLTRAMADEMRKNPHVIAMEVESETNGGAVYPLGHNDWTRDNYGPIYIPRKGDRILITADNYWIYRRIADAYEHQPIHIGEEYTFLMDYYWMQGDNRHNSADSRYWGFVPEDHIVGRPVFVWLSVEKDKPWFKGHIRWDRLGMKGDK